MKALIENRFGPIAVVLIALAVLFGLAHLTTHITGPAPQAKAAPPRARVAVQSVTAVCPDPARSTISVLTPAARGTGSVTVAEQGGKGKPSVIDRPGPLWQKEVDRSGPVLVTGAGTPAAGLEAAQTTTVTTGGGRGLSGVRCVEPSSSTWLVGPGPAAAHDVRLHLANADSAVATVELAIYAGEGPVVGDHGLALAPGEHRSVRLADLAPSPLVMAVEVRTRTGRVAVAARADLGDGRGVDWLPAAAPPATKVVVPGLPGGGGRRELYVAAPGETDVVVGVKAVTEDGSYALKGRENVEVPAGSVATLDVSTGIGGQAAALVLTAPVPVVAGVVVTGPGEKPDVAFSAGAPPIDLGSSVADNRSGKGRTTRLILTAPDRAARVRVQVVPSKGTAPAPVDADVPAARTRQVKLPKIEGSYGLVITPLPGSGPVYGGRVLEERTEDGPLLSVQPLALGRAWTLVPPMTDSAATVLP
ncbi:DUF5719 family protein [Spongiactinospora sp. TRM90649]|uniref:DUF5719 family protein n=1 Tax=Spongiactinospora sp. TRM90649 TaxID=3031114 RepID=UPI0023F83AEC|nr:DUF5719 family protein [Spongiactinospora sp. TRM90649]MDF5751160.1 DUF5719 family protein [Spongiactinospora sp. TRM90649]